MSITEALFNSECKDFTNGIKVAAKFARLGIWEWSSSNETFIFSDELREMIGAKDAERINSLSDYISLIHEADRHNYREHLHHVIENFEPIEVEYRMISHSKNMPIFVSERIQAFTDASGKLEKIIGFTKDISDLKITEDDLTLSELNLKQAFEIANLLNWRLHIKSGKLEWSKGIEKILGFIPQHIQQFTNLIHPGDKKFVLQSGEEAIKGKPYHIEYRIVVPNDGIRTIYERAEVFFDRDDNPEVMIGTLQDITERKNTEMHLVNSDKLSLIGQLAAGIAHEIRNPLTSIGGFIQLLQSGVQEKDVYYTIMIDELDRIEFIVNEFLSLAKPSEASYHKHNMASIISEVVKLLESQMNLNNITIQEKIEKDLPKILCSEHQIKQVFINVLKNAMDAMGNGGTISIHAAATENHSVTITIRDEGCGIQQEELQYIGEPFYTTKEKGTGLGIMVCKKIIREHKGELTIESDEGEGTTVTITMPIE